MAATILENTIRMTADYAGAIPGVGFTTRNGVDLAVMHQGRNFLPILAGTAERHAGERACIKVTAEVDVMAENEDAIRDHFGFHLLQLWWNPVDYALYAGMTPGDGSMKLDFVAAPGMASHLLLDAPRASDGNYPYVERKNLTVITRPGSAAGPWHVRVVLYDHPFLMLPLRLPNFATASAKGDVGKLNYLYEVSRSLFLWTSFVVSDLDKAVIRPFGFIGWKSRLQARIGWKKGGADEPRPAVQIITSYFTADDYLAGTPNSEAARLIADPPGDDETYNVIGNQAIVAALRSVSNSAGVQASKVWSASVPQTHFAP